MEAPLISKMSKSQVSSMAASTDAIQEDVGMEESQCSPASMNLYSQAPYMTQIPTQEPATQAYGDTQSSIFPGSTSDEQQQASSAVEETLELPAPSPAVLPPSSQESLPLSIEEEEPAHCLTANDHEVSDKEASLQLKTVALVNTTEDVSIEKEENTDAKVDEDPKEVKLEDEESQTGSFQPATQMPFDNDDLELEEDDRPEASAVEEPLLPTMSTAISIQKDEPEESSAVELDGEEEKASESDEEEQFVTKVPFEFFSRLLKYCDEDPTKFFSTPEETIERLYEKYERFKEERESDKVLPSLESLLPRESSPIRPVTKKRVVFESEADFEEVSPAAAAAVRMPILKKAKKSMLLPNDSSKKVDWDSLTPSSPINENHARESPNRIEDEPARLNQKQAKGRRPFTEEETANLIDGVRKYGRKWAVILTCYKFNDRTSVDLKDKARNLARKGIINLPAVQNE